MTIKELTNDEVIDYLWGELTIDQVRYMRSEHPEVVQRAKEAHQRVWHDHQ